MSDYFSAPGTSTFDAPGNVDPPTQKEIAQIQRILKFPDLFPEEFKGWLVRYLESNPPRILSTDIAGLNSPGVMRLIYDTTLTGTAATFDVTNISQDFKHLKIFVAGQSDQAVNLSGITMRLNNDSGANYSYQDNQISNATVTTATTAGATAATVGVTIGTTPANTNIMGALEITIFNYTGSKHKSWMSDGGVATGTAASTEWRSDVGIWASTAAVNQVTVRTPGNWIAGSRFTLYGIG